MSHFTTIPECRKILDALVVNTPLIQKCNVLATPKSSEHTITGTAFDHMARWYLTRRYPDTVKYLPLAIVERSAKRYTDQYNQAKNQLENPTNHDIVYQFSNINKPIEELKLSAERVSLLVKTVQREYKKYLGTGEMTHMSADAILKTMVSPLEQWMHKPRAPAIESDMLNMYSIMKNSPQLDTELKTAKSIQLGTKIELCSYRAYPDIIADDLVIDIKAAQTTTFKLDYKRQLLVHCAMLNTYHKHQPIQRVGIYFARHGQLVTTHVPTANWPTVVDGLSSAADKSLGRKHKIQTSTLDRHVESNTRVGILSYLKRLVCRRAVAHNTVAQ
ncbi:MAG: hypothetical protein OXI27_00390 [Thaumarchaeota archaeon]|nr:hypothetical protein [Nitrososphaerota archaeon]